MINLLGTMDPLIPIIWKETEECRELLAIMGELSKKEMMLVEHEGTIQLTDEALNAYYAYKARKSRQTIDLKAIMDRSSIWRPQSLYCFNRYSDMKVSIGWQFSLR